MKIKKIVAMILASTLLVSLAACDNSKPKETETPQPTTSDNAEDLNKDEKYLLIDTTEYQLKFNMLGSWKEYAGTAEVREKAQGVLESSTDETETDSAYFYVLIEPYVIEEGVTPKTKFTEQIQSNFPNASFDSISDMTKDDNIKLVYTYTITEDNTKVKNYQYTMVIDGYVVAFVYSAPELIYNIQKGYVNDMIETAEFSVKNGTDTPIETEVPAK